MDECCRTRDQLHVVSSKDQLILNILGAIASDAGKHVHHTHALLAQEVTDLHNLSLLLNVNVDGEMCVHQTHLVLEALGHSCDKVLDMAGAGADGGESLALAEMAVNAELLLTLLLKQVHIHRKMLEVAS